MAFAACLALAALGSPVAWAKAKKPKPAPSPSPPSSKVSLRELPPILKDIEQKYAKAGTLSAEFSQASVSGALKQKKTSTGRILIQRPDKVRWETLKPDPSTLVSDGKVYWYYTPPFDESEPGQLIEAPAAKLRTRFESTLLSGDFSPAIASRDVRLREKGENTYELKPKLGSGGAVKSALIEIDPAEKLIRKITLTNRDGSHSEISLSQIVLGKDLPEETFHFKAPPNTDRMNDKLE